MQNPRLYSHIQVKIYIEGGTTMTLLKNIVNMKTPITVLRKVQQFPRISTHLMIAE
jgi:hypothetical protein